jgi:hypothetical protein
MGLNIYETADPSAGFSNDQSFSNSLSLTVDGSTGATVSKRLYLRNDDSLLYYENISVQPVILSGKDIITGENTGFEWRLISGDAQPLEAQWGLVNPGNSISLSDIGSPGSGDTTTYLPFWLRISVPRGAAVESYQGIGLRISADENSV